ncbi:OB-fold nucleic acid binding domain-containing protein [Nanoarchaeota archaeon]
MKEKTLLRVALVVSLIGIVILFFISEFKDIDETRIDDITINDLDKDVKVIGTISQMRDTDKVMIMEVMQAQKVKVVVFKDDNFSLKKGDYIEVLGKVEEYEGELEIIGDRIRLID